MRIRNSSIESRPDCSHDRQTGAIGPAPNGVKVKARGALQSRIAVIASGSAAMEWSTFTPHCPQH
jgi:hypothetical protein